jgi:putative holliday junction resolvase
MNVPKRILGLDFGDRRIGVAVSDEMRWTAQGVTTIRRTTLEKDLQQIKAIMEQYGNVSDIVVGMPFNMDGSEGERALITRDFMTALENAFSLPVHAVDERLTTWEAERLLISGDVSRKKRKEKIDQLAASIILQTFLQTNQLTITTDAATTTTDESE